jgi:ABC transporter substrate binding protein (PQQ-dependent alcohol dehydrogenase system)
MRYRPGTKCGLCGVALRIGTQAVALLVAASAACADPEIAVSDTASGAELTAKVAYLGKAYPEPAPLSLLDKILTDEGIQGARLANKENNLTGRLIQQRYELVEAVLPEDGNVIAKAKELLGGGLDLIVADLEPEDLMAVADLPEAANAIILNVRSSDDRLRGENCRSNVFHIIPSWSMRADALAQYLVWKKWRRWLLIEGNSAVDKDYGNAIRRAARKFGAKLVEERTYRFDAGSRRTDTGHQQIQTQMPLLTQGAAEHDVVMVADVSEAFGEYLAYRTYEPRPIVGTQGLQAVSWHRSFEQYAGTQLQNRFERQTHRVMRERDYTAWLGVRVFGEVVTRIAKTGAADVRKYMLSQEFEIAAFKGLGLTFRKWNNQLRQPILITGPRALVSISPQDGFLHEKFLTDTMGYDVTESKCRFSL